MLGASTRVERLPRKVNIACFASDALSVAARIARMQLGLSFTYQFCPEDC